MEESNFITVKSQDHIPPFLKDLRKSTSFDTKLICQDGSMYVHRLMLCTVSRHLGYLFDDQLPGEIAFVHLPDFPVEIIKILVRFMYKGDMKFPKEREKEVQDTMRALGWIKWECLLKGSESSSPVAGGEEELEKEVNKDKAAEVIGSTSESEGFEAKGIVDDLKSKDVEKEKEKEIETSSQNVDIPSSVPLNDISRGLAILHQRQQSELLNEKEREPENVAKIAVELDKIPNDVNTGPKSTSVKDGQESSSSKGTNDKELVPESDSLNKIRSNPLIVDASIGEIVKGFINRRQQGDSTPKKNPIKSKDPSKSLDSHENGSKDLSDSTSSCSKKGTRKSLRLTPSKEHQTSNNKEKNEEPKVKRLAVLAEESASPAPSSKNNEPGASNAEPDNSNSSESAKTSPRRSQRTSPTKNLPKESNQADNSEANISNNRGQKRKFSLTIGEYAAKEMEKKRGKGVKKRFSTNSSPTKSKDSNQAKSSTSTTSKRRLTITVGPAPATKRGLRAKGDKEALIMDMKMWDKITCCSKCKKYYTTPLQAVDCLVKHKMTRCWICLECVPIDESEAHYSTHDGYKKGGLSCPFCTKDMDFESLNALLIHFKSHKVVE